MGLNILFKRKTRRTRRSNLTCCFVTFHWTCCLFLFQSSLHISLYLTMASLVFFFLTLASFFITHVNSFLLVATIGLEVYTTTLCSSSLYYLYPSLVSSTWFVSIVLRNIPLSNSVPLIMSFVPWYLMTYSHQAVDETLSLNETKCNTSALSAQVATKFYTHI